MGISIRCECGRKLNLADKLAGRQIVCPDCGDVLTVPNRKSASAPPEPGRKQRRPQQSAPPRTNTPPPQRPGKRERPTTRPRPKNRQRNRKSNTNLKPIVAGVVGLALLAGGGVLVTKSGLLESKPASDGLTLTTPPTNTTSTVSGSPSNTSGVPANANYAPSSLQLSESDDPTLQLANDFVGLAAASRTKDAVKLINRDALQARIDSPAGSEAAQSKRLPLDKMLNNFSGYTLEGTPVNGVVRHWRVIGATTYEGQTAALVRYFSEPKRPDQLLGQEDFLAKLIPLMTFEEFSAAAGAVFVPSDLRPGDYDRRVPQWPNANGFTTPRVGYLLLCCENVAGQMQITDLANPMAKLRFSRAAGVLYLRDWRVTGFGISKEKIKAEPIQVSIFGELPLDGIDQGVEIDRAAAFREYKDPSQGEVKIGPVLEQFHGIRAHRLNYLNFYLRSNATGLQTAIDEFRGDYPDDLGADLALVSLAMVPDEIRIGGNSAAIIGDAADRLYQSWRDPYLRYVQWLAAEAQADESGANRYLQEARLGGFETAEMHLRLITKAAEAKDKSKAIAALRQLSNYWDPNAPEPSPEKLSRIKRKWDRLADRLSSADGRGTTIGDRMRQSGRDRAMSRIGKGPPSGMGQGRRPGGNRGNFGGPPPGFGQSQQRSGSGRSGPPPMTGPTIIVEIKLNGTRGLMPKINELAKAIGSNQHQYSRSNDVAKATFRYTGSAQSVADKITFGTVTETDETARKVFVTIENN